MRRKLVRAVTEIKPLLLLIIPLLTCITAIADDGCEVGSKINIALCRGTNVVRAYNGLPALQADSGLNEMAWEMAYLLAYYSPKGSLQLSHDLPGGNSFTERFARWGITGAENIAVGQRSTGRVIEAWQNSPGHLRNMTGNYSRIGTAYYGGFWVQVFAY